MSRIFSKVVTYRHSNHLVTALLKATIIFLFLSLPLVVFADDVSNNIDASVDATAEQMPLILGGSNGTTRLYIVPRNGDGKNGCNLTGGTTLTVSINSNNPSVATVSPSSITFTSCVTETSGPTLTVTPVGVGSATISLSQISNNSGGSFNLATATFVVNVQPPPNTPPSVSVTGVNGGVSYEFGSVPAAVCSVSDAEDGPSTFPATLSAISGPLSAFGLGTQTASCSYTDGGGLTASAAETYGIVDTIAPAINLLSRTPANGSGWNSGNVVVSWSCSDSGSGVVQSQVSRTVSSEGAGQSASGTCADNAGNLAGGTVNNINIDKTAPGIAFDSRTPANGNGWNNSNVTALWNCSDSGSGPVSPTVSDTVSGEGTNQTASGTCTDLAGNSASDTINGINIDKTAPAISLLSRTPANGNGWNSSSVALSWSCTDSGSGPINNTVNETISTEGSNQSASATCTDNAGNFVSDTVSNIHIDKTVPSIAFSGRTPANGSGWNNGNVMATWSCSDGGSGPVSATVNDTVSSEGTNQTASGTCIDLAGNSASDSVNGINIDKTAPTGVGFVGSISDGGSYYFGFVPTSSSCTANGDISGLASCTVSGYGNAKGSHTLTATAVDNAGNSSSTTLNYTVLGWTLVGFNSPVDMGLTVWNTVKGGSTVPLKFRVFAGPTEITNTSMVVMTAKSVPCNGGADDPVDVDMLSSGSTSLRYDTTERQFIQNWKTPRQTNKCYQVTMTASDGSSIVANFKLK